MSFNSLNTCLFHLGNPWLDGEATDCHESFVVIPCDPPKEILTRTDPFTSIANCQANKKRKDELNKI